MHIEAIEKMIECLSTKANAQLEGNFDETDAKELGEVIDMIKDLAEAKYYYNITKEMEEAKEKEEILNKLGIDTNTVSSSERFYNDNRYISNTRYIPSGYRRGYNMPYYPDIYDPNNEFYRNKHRLYYDGNGLNSNIGSSNQQMTDTIRTKKPNMPMYDDSNINYGNTESAYAKAKRYYSESKMNHVGNTQEDKNAKLSSLDEYIRELSSDVTELIQGASPEERTTLKNRLTTLASKV